MAGQGQRGTAHDEDRHGGWHGGRRPTAPATLIASVQRALRLLEAVSAHESGAPAKALARQVGLPLGTTYHLLRTLTYEGYLRRLDDGCYILGDGIEGLRGESRLQAWLGRSRPVLAGLRDSVRAASYLAVYEDGEIVLRAIVDAPRYPRTDLWVGFRDAAHATALGKGILARLDRGARSDYLARHRLFDLTARTITSERELVRRLDASTEWAEDSEEYAVGTACLAVPFRTASVTGAVAVSFGPRRLRELSALVRPLQHAACRLAASLTLTI